MAGYLGRGKLIQPVEAGVIAIAAIALAVVFNEVDAFDRFVAFMAQHEEWEIDEFVFVLLFSGIGALFLAFRRAADLVRAIDAREAAEARAMALARHDPLTGLANRRVLHEELPAMIAGPADSAGQLVLFLVDLDHFKPVNDVLGHDAGDAVLVEVAARLNRVCGAHGLAARVGGDEFVVAMRQDEGTDAPARMAAQIIRLLSEPYDVDGRKVEIGATVGIARSPLDATRGDDLLRAADVAMYDGKRAGKGTYRFFHADMDERLLARAALESELRGAIENGEIVPYFQPVIALGGRRIIGFEALARWEHPTRDTIAPDVFIPIAEDLGLIHPLAMGILRAGCIAARDWDPDTTLSINLSPIQLKDRWLAASVMGILAETGFPANRLILEVTENAIIDEIDSAAELFTSLQNLGARIAMDDFGKGYSSLSHLRQLKFNHLKIDSSFVQSMDTEESRQIVSAIAGLGKALGMPVTAEGVETEQVAETLRALGCEQAQGFHFGKPVLAGDAARMFDLGCRPAPRLDRTGT